MKESQAEVKFVGELDKIMSIERYAFYERSKQAHAVIQTDKRRFYDCFAVRKRTIW